MKTIFDARNVTMLMDLYELTMAGGYFLEDNTETRVAFDVTYRKNPDRAGFSIFAGLEQVIEFLEGMHFDADDIKYLRSLNLFTEDFLTYLASFRFRGDLIAFPEGTIMYPYEPIMTIIAPIIDAQIVETAILAQVNHQSLIATKSHRIVRAAKGRPVSEFGARRAHNIDAAFYGGRAAYIGGVNGTATLMCGEEFQIPVSGTMGHSWVMRHEDEITAFRIFAKCYPQNCILLVDTYDVISSGVPNAIRVFEEMRDQGIQLTNYGIRLDSGDLAYLSKKARQMLDEAGFEKGKIIVSNSLNEETITSLLNQGACIDSFGVGEQMITAKSDPVFGAVYKLAAVEEDGIFVPRIKISETVEKITNPGLKEVYRVYDASGHAVADLITKYDENPDLSVPYRYVDPNKPWKNRFFENCTIKCLRQIMVKDGVRMVKRRSLDEIRDYVRKQLQDEIWEEEQRFEFPHVHYVDMSPSLYELKMSMLHENRADVMG